MGRYKCMECLAEFERPMERQTLWGEDLRLCPLCFGSDIEEMEMCPECHAGWRVLSDKVCPKCRDHLKGELQLFARKFSPAALSVLDDMLEGSGLETFV